MREITVDGVKYREIGENEAKAVNRRYEYNIDDFCLEQEGTTILLRFKRELLLSFSSDGEIYRYIMNDDKKSYFRFDDEQRIKTNVD